MANFATSFIDRIVGHQSLEFAEGATVTLRVGSWSQQYSVGGERDGLLVLNALGSEMDAPIHAAKLVMGEIPTADGLAEFGVRVVSAFGGCLLVAPGSARIRERRASERDRSTPPSSGVLDNRTCLVLDASSGGARLLSDGYRQPGMVVEVSCVPWTGGAWVLSTNQTPAGYELRVVRMVI